jgi:NADP-dependent 3-hydroxy acid dehydrogenase YdfG
MAFPYKNVLIIGATSGIGKKLANKLVQNGTPTIISGRRQENMDEFVRQHGPDKVKSKVIDVLQLDKVCLSTRCHNVADSVDPPIRGGCDCRKP